MRYVLIGAVILLLIDRFVVHLAWALPVATILVVVAIGLALRR